MRRVSVTVTTNGAGAGSASTDPVKGLLKRVSYVKTDFANGVDFTVVDDVATAILTGTDVNASAAWHPRQPTHGADSSASLYAAAGEPVESDFPIDGVLTVTVSSGGDTKTGTFHFWLA